MRLYTIFVLALMTILLAMLVDYISRGLIY